MIRFLQAFGRSPLAMATVSVAMVLWLVSAALEMHGAPQAVPLGLVLAGAASMIAASYLVWKNTDEDAAKRIEDLERRISELSKEDESKLPS